MIAMVTWMHRTQTHDHINTALSLQNRCRQRLGWERLRTCISPEIPTQFGDRMRMKTLWVMLASIVKIPQVKMLRMSRRCTLRSFI